jgi:hypothetical protein
MVSFVFSSIISSFQSHAFALHRLFQLSSHRMDISLHIGLHFTMTLFPLYRLLHISVIIQFLHISMPPLHLLRLIVILRHPISSLFHSSDCILSSDYSFSLHFSLHHTFLSFTCMLPYFSLHYFYFISRQLHISFATDYRYFSLFNIDHWYCQMLTVIFFIYFHISFITFFHLFHFFLIYFITWCHNSFFILFDTPLEFHHW